MQGEYPILRSRVVATVSLVFFCGCAGGQNAIPQARQPSDIVTNTASGAVAPAPATALTETPLWSDAFVDSMGVNVHLHYTDSAYYLNYPHVRGELTKLGIRHLRDTLSDTADPAYFAHLTELQQLGFGFLLTSSITTTSATITRHTAQLPAGIDGFEAPNEYDVSGDPLWIADLLAFIPGFYQAVKSATPAIPVVGPSLSQAWEYTQLGDIAADADIGNLHNYFAGHNPGSPGWGAAGFGSVYGTTQYWMGAAATAMPGRPVYTTESGYCTAAGAAGAVDDTVQARYYPRLFLEQSMAGIRRTYAYELLDDGGTGCTGSYGLMTATVYPKPAFTALANFIQVLSDPGTGFAAKPLQYGLSAQASTIAHQLFQKRDGRYILALWNEIPAAADSATPQTVNISLPEAPASTSAEIFNENGTFRNSPVTQSGNVLNLSVNDAVTLVTIVPPAQGF